ncbi:MAG: hypothetical protein SFV24_17200 [Gemmatimonadales bacterium]|nr:hypothetical protein [Gemmatimonadales bacterium]
MSRPARDILPPRPRRIPWLAIAVSLGLHALLLLVKVGAWLPPPREQPSRIVLVPLGTEGPRAVEMAYRDPSAGSARRRPRSAGITTLPMEETGPTPEPTPEPETPVAAPALPVDTGSAGPSPRRGGLGRVGPAFGDGTLWVRPLPLPPRDLARALTRTQAELVDSAVTAIVQAYIDSVLTVAPANEPLPRWTTKVGDQQLGLDAQWIYLGPIKIPTALVAGLLNAVGALPLGSSAEMSDYTRFRALQRMREDVQIAARRAQTMEDFKRAIRELRAQREREREFARNQRTPPTPPPDTSGTRKP